MFNHSKLLGRIKEVGITQEELAHRIGIKPNTLSFKLNNGSKFKTDEILLLCEVLQINTQYIPLYFFTLKV